MGKEKRFFAFFQKTFYKSVHFFGKSGAARKKALRDAHFCGTIKADPEYTRPRAHEGELWLC